MEQGHSRRSPLERAKTQERIATYSIALIVGLVVVMLARAVTVTAAQSAADQGRTMSVIVTIVQLIVTISTLLLVRHQVHLAVQQIEQADAGELRLQQLTDQVRRLADATGAKTTTKSIPTTRHDGVQARNAPLIPRRRMTTSVT